MTRHQPAPGTSARRRAASRSSLWIFLRAKERGASAETTARHDTDTSDGANGENAQIAAALNPSFGQTCHIQRCLIRENRRDYGPVRFWGVTTRGVTAIDTVAGRLGKRSSASAPVGNTLAVTLADWLKTIVSS